MTHFYLQTFVKKMFIRKTVCYQYLLIQLFKDTFSENAYLVDFQKKLKQQTAKINPF